jgi:hypothetical protein
VQAAEKRWNKQQKDATSNANSNAQAMHKQCPSPSPSPSKNKINIYKPNDVSQNIWDDFVLHRKSKKAPITETALKGLKREADKAGISLEKAIETTIERNWVGFKAEWANGKEYVSQKSDDKQWMFSDQGIVAKANELGVHSMGLTYQQLKEKCLLVMAKKAMQ